MTDIGEPAGGGARWRITPRLVFGLLILAFGVISLLDRLGFDTGHVLRFLLPGGLLLVGLTCLVQCWGRRGAFWGVVWIVAGSWWLLDVLGMTSVKLGTVFFPAVLLLLGGSIVWRALRGPSVVWRRKLPGGETTAATSEDGAVVNMFATLAGLEQRSSSPAFRGGDISAVMGGATLDLRSARIAGEEAVLEVFAFWGGIEIHVPDDWAVVSKVLPIMGGFEDKTRPRTGEAHGRLVVRGVVLMGGVEVGN